MIEKDSCIRAEIQMAFLAMIAKDMGCLRPQGTKSLLPPFAKKPQLKRANELKITSPHIDDLLHTCACVEHGCQQGVVPATIPTFSIDSRKDGFDFVMLKILDYALTGAFERNAHNLLNPGEVFGMIGSHVAKKNMDSGQADISGGHAVFANPLQMVKESNDVTRFKIPKVQVVNLAFSFRSQETKEEQQAITIAVNCVGAHATNSRQIVCKVLPQTECELVRRCDFHAFLLSRTDSGTTSPP